MVLSAGLARSSTGRQPRLFRARRDRCLLGQQETRRRAGPDRRTPWNRPRPRSRRNVGTWRRRRPPESLADEAVADRRQSPRMRPNEAQSMAETASDVAFDTGATTGGGEKVAHTGHDRRSGAARGCRFAAGSYDHRHSRMVRPAPKSAGQLNTARGSRNASRPNVPYSRPIPDCLKPPNGASGSCGAPLMTTRPACNCAATCFA
jgi:hypothetical protein